MPTNTKHATPIPIPPKEEADLVFPESALSGAVVGSRFESECSDNIKLFLPV